ncbi:hypothetical protein GCM10023237_01420 [Streptomyces coeruleoprunus]
MRYAKAGVWAVASARVRGAGGLAAVGVGHGEREGLGDLAGLAKAGAEVLSQREYGPPVAVTV